MAESIRWNTPLMIPLDSAIKTTVGRLPVASREEGNHFVVLHSQMLPYMLSEKHAVLSFDQKHKRWMIEDLKSLNGVYVNAIRIQAGRATRLSDNDEICFGKNVVNNELKYRLFLRGSKASLERTTDSFTGICLSPPRHASTSVKGCVGGSGVSKSAPPCTRIPRKAMPMQQFSARKRLKLSSGGEQSSAPVASPPPPTCLPLHLSYQSSPMQSSFAGLPVTSSPSQSPNSHSLSLMNSSLPVTISSAVRPSQPVQVSILPIHGHLRASTPGRCTVSGATGEDTNDLFDDLVSKTDGGLLSTTDQEVEDLFDEIVANLQDKALDTPEVPTCKSTDQEVEDLFDEIVASSQDRVLDGLDTPAVPTYTSADQEVEDLFDEIIASSQDKALDGVDTSAAVPTFKSTDQEVEDLFDEIVVSSQDRVLDGVDTPAVPICSSTDQGGPQNRFDEASAVECTPQVPGAETPPDSPAEASAVNVLPKGEAIQDKTQQEKDQLLSSIKALKNELAAKNELISKQEHRPSEDSPGGVVTSMKEEFACIICTELFISAHTLPCSHSFCEICIKEWIKTNKECPICRKNTTTGPVRTLVLDNVIATMESKLSEKERKEREDLKEERKAKLSSDPTLSTTDDIPTNDPLNDSMEYGSSDGFNSNEDSFDHDHYLESDEDSYDRDPEEFYDIDSEEYSDLDIDYCGGVFVYNGGYGGFGRCYHCGERGHWRPQCPYR